MSMEDMDNASTIAGPDRPLFPEVNFTASTATFSGTAKPGLTIKLSSNVDGQAASVTVGKDGKWKIILGEAERWYTIFKIWAFDSESGQESDKVQFTRGGYNPKLEDVYVGETAACGHAPKGSDIAIYASNGKLFARAKAMFGRGFWRVKFLEENMPKAGDRVCVIAKHPNGNTSMPHFTEVHAFSVWEASNYQFSGSGARPGDLIQLLEEESGAMIETVEANDDGKWTLKLANQLESDALTRIQRIHKNGTVSRGPGRIYLTSGTVAPVILGLTYDRIWGTGLPYGKITFMVFPKNSHTPVSGTFANATADANGNWSAPPPMTPQPGYTFTASQQPAGYGGPMSNYHSGIEYGTPLPVPPLVGGLENGQYKGFASSGSIVLISTPQDGVQLYINTDYDGSFYFPDPTAYGIPANDTVLFNVAEAATEYNTPWAVTSPFTGRSQSSVITVDTPVITTAETTLFAGTEATLPTTVEIYDDSTGQGVINPEMTVQQDHSWNSNSSKIQETVQNGQKVYAQATYSDPSISGGLGPTSQPSDPAIVGMPQGNTKKPLPPQITSCDGTSIYGVSQINTYVYLHYVDSYDNQQKDPPKIGVTAPPGSQSKTNWTYSLPGHPLSGGSKVWATAEFAGSSNQSDTYYRSVGDKNGGPLYVDEVHTNYVKGRAGRAGLWILAWRTSDGMQLVSQQTSGSSEKYKFYYENNLTLDENDQLNVVSALAPEGNFGPFNRQDEGYINPQEPPDEA
ncbi:hypothetical protein [uncultured Martelella sp.]|uniref:hypothetical protein n=1 Tax=uncultured Martelella sp. TaxID=392331 RepID=UPI0029C9661E|nr:hypothetical protein [uncultured Martelella sp.]